MLIEMNDNVAGVVALIILISLVIATLVWDWKIPGVVALIILISLVIATLVWDWKIRKN
jgi:Flp pilus assembly protein TadB